MLNVEWGRILRKVRLHIHQKQAPGSIEGVSAASETSFHIAILNGEC